MLDLQKSWMEFQTNHLTWWREFEQNQARQREREHVQALRFGVIVSVITSLLSVAAAAAVRYMWGL